MVEPVNATMQQCNNAGAGSWRLTVSSSLDAAFLISAFLHSCIPALLHCCILQ
jgi:hypothetical protein